MQKTLGSGAILLLLVLVAGCGSQQAAAPVTITAVAQAITAPPVTMTWTPPPVTEISTVQHTQPPVTMTSVVKQTVVKTLPRVTLAPVTVNHTATVVKTPDAVTVTAQPAAAAASFGDGTELVGTDVQPGTYRSPGGSSCYWERLSGASGSLDDIIANDLGTSNPVVEIAASDYAFTSSDCGGWTKIG